ncbi:FMN-binding protein [Streptomyces diastatochromogenes]|uniref:FMN-binding protein n=1 Tax=Streptomyces diastatochromogenes TaxID=42236 RepID=A0A233SKY5_STRDA|nr:FMN-binding protein [Streptomyces diastatochromogenes]MCZ0990129.1 FMN-binding protein [Streptomyces diastatochromogenes]OXY96298.1 FMN-binding protein [Streptomyces diastatochromogenes]
MHALKKNRPLRRIVLASAATVSGMVLLLSLKPHTSPTLATASTKSPTTSSSSSPTAGSSSGTKSITGDTVQTRWGPVQVRVTIKSGTLTDVTAVSYPQDNPRDQEINSYALPQLRREALAAQSAQIDTVSGATYTSDGYRQSLQSALDSAGL